MTWLPTSTAHSDKSEDNFSMVLTECKVTARFPQHVDMPKIRTMVMLKLPNGNERLTPLDCCISLAHANKLRRRFTSLGPWGKKKKKKKKKLGKRRKTPTNFH